MSDHFLRKIARTLDFARFRPGAIASIAQAPVQVHDQENPQTRQPIPATPIAIGRKVRFGLGLGLGLFLLGGCQATTVLPDDPNKPNVVTTSTIITDLVKQVAGDQVDLQGLLQPGSDPHVYEPVPTDSITIEQADLVFYNGLNLEPALIDLIEGANGGVQRVALADLVKPLPITKDGQKVSDPHVWGDVENVVVMVQAIRDRLSELNPGDAATFSANTQTLIRQLDELDQWVQAQIKTIPADQRAIVSTHDAFQYYAQAYGLEVIGTLIGVSTEEQPSAQTIKTLVQAIKAAGVPAIFAETTINPQLIGTVAQEAGVKLAEPPLYSDSIGAAGSDGDSYIKMIEHNTCSIVVNLGGVCQPFSRDKSMK